MGWCSRMFSRIRTSSSRWTRKLKSKRGTKPLSWFGGVASGVLLMMLMEVHAKKTPRKHPTERMWVQGEGDINRFQLRSRSFIVTGSNNESESSHHLPPFNWMSPNTAGFLLPKHEYMCIYIYTCFPSQWMRIFQSFPDKKGLNSLASLENLTEFELVRLIDFISNICIILYPMSGDAKSTISWWLGSWDWLKWYSWCRDFSVWSMVTHWLTSSWEMGVDSVVRIRHFELRSSGIYIYIYKYLFINSMHTHAHAYIYIFI